MGIKYPLEGFIKYLIINTVGNRSQCTWDTSYITVANDNMHDQHCSCITGYDYICNVT